MRVKIISRNDKKGGAARAAYRLHNSLNKSSYKFNISSQMHVASKISQQDNVYMDSNFFKVSQVKINNKIEKFVQKLQYAPDSNYRSLSFMPTNLHNQLNKDSFQLINLHWIQGGMISIEGISKIRKPSVWTLHDSWAFCGSEHYPENIYDSRYKEGYLKNNRIKSHSGIDLDRWCWERKVKNWVKPIQIVCPSNWLANCVKKSFLMNEWPVKVIPNPINIDIFKPVEKMISRQTFNLPPQSKLIFFGAISGIKERRKGWHLFELAMEKLKLYEPKIEIVLLGNSDTSIKSNCKIPMHFIGKINEDNLLASLYSAVDVVVIPSSMENLTQIGTEAHCCGTPIAAFNCSGMPDIVKNKESGFLAKPYDCIDLAEGIYWILKNKIRYEKLRISARDYAKNNWGEELIAKKYAELYKQVLEKKNL